MLSKGPSPKAARWLGLKQRWEAAPPEDQFGIEFHDALAEYRKAQTFDRRPGYVYVGEAQWERFKRIQRRNPKSLELSDSDNLINHAEFEGVKVIRVLLRNHIRFTN